MHPSRALARAQATLHSPHAPHSSRAGALGFLEAEAGAGGAAGRDARVWACIAHLRRREGDAAGGDAAERRARALAADEAGVAAVGDAEREREEGGEREDDGDREESGESGEGGEGGESGERGVVARGRSARCRELLASLGVPVPDARGRHARVQALVQRTRRLRALSEGLLAGRAPEAM